MEKSKNTAGLEILGDEILDAVSGGQSLYDTANDISRESWFVSLITKLMGEREGGPNMPLSAQANEAPDSAARVWRNGR